MLCRIPIAIQDRAICISMARTASSTFRRGLSPSTCSMGYVALYLMGNEDDFNYQLEGAMGNIDIGGMSFSGFGQEKKIDNGASKNIEVECSMGNISILFMD